MTLRNIAIDANTGDFTVAAGQLVMVSDGESIAQAIGSALQVFKGEYYLDEEEGMPYFQDILGVKNPDPNVLESIFRGAIAAVPGVLQITALDLEMDKALRSLSVEWRVSSEFGELNGTVTL